MKSVVKKALPPAPSLCAATAVLKAIQALKKPATAAEINAYVKEHRLLRDSKMDTRKACSWILAWLKKHGAVVVKERTKKA